MSLKAHHVLKQNVDALLHARHLKRKDLAMYCRRTESWLSQIFTNPERNMPLKYFDRIADFFGLAPYQLLQPGIAPQSERRSGRDRRSGVDRRISRVAEMLQPAPSMAEFEQEIRRLTPEAFQRFVRRAMHALHGEELGPDTAGQRGPRETTDKRSVKAPRRRGEQTG